MRIEEAVMGELSIYHWLLVALVVILFFGGRKIPELMRGMGEGIKSFRDGINGPAKGGSEIPSDPRKP
jgi:sec-independent protein translocase protein TatA